MLIAVSTIFYLVRRQKRRRSGATVNAAAYDKAQLDSTEVKPKEISGNGIEEIGDSAPPRFEMDAGYVGEELGH